MFCQWDLCTIMIMISKYGITNKFAKWCTPPSTTQDSPQNGLQVQVNTTVTIMILTSANCPAVRIEKTVTLSASSYTLHNTEKSEIIMQSSTHDAPSRLSFLVDVFNVRGELIFDVQNLTSDLDRLVSNTET
jgi:hypothetical protein